MSFFIVVLVTLFFMNGDQMPYIYVLAFLSGIGVATAFLVPWSMLPDVIDLDELNTGTRREGDLYSIFVLFQKVGLGIAMAISSWVLGWAGYVSPYQQEEHDQQDGVPDYRQYQPESVRMTLRVMLTLVPAGLIVLSFIPVYLYPITKRRHQEILMSLSERRSAS